MTATTPSVSKVHIYEGIASQRPDERAEVVSHCGYVEECSGSGRHEMVHGLEGATCPKCIATYQRELAAERASMLREERA